MELHNLYKVLSVTFSLLLELFFLILYVKFQLFYLGHQLSEVECIVAIVILGVGSLCCEVF